MTRPSTRPGRRLASIAVLVALATTVLLPTGAASAASYRYWGFYELNGSTWAYATKGPDQVTPTDGSVEGWRFAVSDGKTPRLPRATATFDQLCGHTKAITGKKRVGVVLDFGRAADNDGVSPPAATGHCAQVAATGTAVDVLAAVSNVRSAKSLICAVDGYPASGCGDAVKAVSAAAAAKDDTVTLKIASAAAKPASSDNTSTGTWIGIGVVAAVVLGLGGLLLSRRRRA